MPTSSFSIIPTLKAAPYRGLADFTQYLPTASEDRKLSEASARIATLLQTIRTAAESKRQPGELPFESINTHSYAELVQLQYGRHTEEFRSLICSCFRNKYYSLTFRSPHSREKGGLAYTAPATSLKLHSGQAQYESSYDPQVADRKETKDDRAKFFPVEIAVQVVSAELQDDCSDILPFMLNCIVEGGGIGGGGTPEHVEDRNYAAPPRILCK